MGRRDPHIFSTLPEAVAATNPQSKLQAPSSKTPGQGTSRDFALCIAQYPSLLAVSAAYPPSSDRYLRIPAQGVDCTVLCAPSITLNVVRGSSHAHIRVQRPSTTGDKPPRHFASGMLGTSLQAIVASSDRFSPSPVNLLQYDQIRLAVTCFVRRVALGRNNFYS
jgi:hypothetical protein